MLTAPAKQQACSLGGTHRPRNLTVEFHHVLPVAWQLRTTVVGRPPFPGQDPDGRGLLWDSRGVWLCPTSHRNTHAWIVRLMRAASDRQSNDPAAAYAAVKPKRRVPPELDVAMLALERFMAEAGGVMSTQGASLLTLAGAGEMGQS